MFNVNKDKGKNKRMDERTKSPNFHVNIKVSQVRYTDCDNKQESPAIADKPARSESLPKMLQFDVLSTLSLTILAYLHSFSCCCVRNLRNPAKFTENSKLWSSRSSKVIDLGVNRKPMYDFLLVTNSNLGRICCRFRVMLKARKSVNFHTPPFFDTLPSDGTPLDMDVIYTPMKSAFNGLQFSRCLLYTSPSPRD